MYDKFIFLRGDILLEDTDAGKFKEIAPQPPPTSDRIKDLLSRGLTAPATLTPDEVRELCASVAYHLISERMK